MNEAAQLAQVINHARRMAQEYATSHVVGSLYNFSETAGREFISSLRKKSNFDTSCHFTDRNVFTIHASPNHDDLLVYFVNSIGNFISTEKDQEPDVFEDKKITRISGTHPSLALASLTEKGMPAITPGGEVPLIEHENIIRNWSPSTESKVLGLKFGLQLLGSIGNLCGCRIEYANGSADLLLKADREQDTEKGISKLERLNKMMVDEISFPRTHSFYVLEGETAVTLQLVALKDLNDKRLVTTLLRKDSLVKSLRDLCVLVLIKGSDIFSVNMKPAASCREYRLWNDHVYNCNQAQGLNAAKTPKEPRFQIDRWVSEVSDTDVQVDAFLPESTMEVRQSPGVGMVYKEPFSPTKKPITKRARTARGNPDAFNGAFTESHRRHGDKEAVTQEKVASSSSRQATEILSTFKESGNLHQPPSIEPPYMPPRDMCLCSLSEAPSRFSHPVISSSATWSVVTRDSKSGNLVDMSVPNEGCAKDGAMVVVDNLQNTTKAKARDIKHTMNQRKASTQASVGGDTALVKCFEETIAHLLLSALPRKGRLGFAADIGRLLINQRFSSSESKSRSFKTSEFASMLSKGNAAGSKTMFTNMLTARSSEAESIVNLLVSKGRRLFQQQPISRKVTYVFNCKAKDGDQLVVEYDGNGGFNIQGSEILIGTLDWHFPKRAWDARLRLTSERFLATDYQRQVKGIVDNIKVVVSGDGQSLEFKTKTIDDNLSIESIVLNRETLHSVTLYPDLILHLTEYQDLQVRQASESIYSGSIQASQVMIKANNLWWGAKLSSVNANAILEGNTILELGETASWTPSSIINMGVVGDLFAATKEIVTQIDHVGFFNRGEGSSNSKATEKRSENTQDTSAKLSRVDPGYW